MSHNLGDLVRQVSTDFRASAMGNARLEARLLVGGLLGFGPETLLAYPERPVSDHAAQMVLSAAKQRAAGAPMAHILGQREFWSLQFEVTPDTLVPRPDTETLLEAALSLVERGPLTILDLGVGSGCILLSLLKELPEAQGVGLDSSAAALGVARRNAKALGLEARVTFVEADFAEAAGGPFDLIVSNPPYIPTPDIEGLSVDVRDHEPRLALDGGADGLDAYRIIAPRLDHLLKPGAYALFEIGVGQAASVTKILEAAQLSVMPPKYDLSGIARCLIANKR